MHFGTKNYLKSTRNHTAKHALNELFRNAVQNVFHENLKICFYFKLFFKYIFCCFDLFISKNNF